MTAPVQPFEGLIRSAARRLFQAAVASALCGGSALSAERRFGWRRDGVGTGQNEARS